MRLLTFAGRRLLWLLLILPGITLVVFALSHVVPADPAALLAGEGGTFSGSRSHEEAIQAIRQQYGLDKPLPVQFLLYLRGLVHGDFGRSIMTQRTVQQDLSLYFPTTLELALSALVIILAAGIPLGVLAAFHHNRWPDAVISVLSISAVSLPIFWLALMFQLVFYGMLNVLPLTGQIDPIHFQPPPRVTGMMVLDSLLAGNAPLFLHCVQHLVLPAVTLAIPTMGTVARLVRSSVLEVMRADFATVARAKGLTERAVMRRHILRNALLPTITVVGLSVGGLLGGATFVETVFNFPGLGLYASQSVSSFDYQAIMGVTIVVAVIRVLANLATDVVYAVADPRITL